MDRTCCGCRIYCNFCCPNEVLYKSEFNCEGCIKVTELPTGLDKITHVSCKNCFNLICIPSLSSLLGLYCPGCRLLTYIPELVNVEVMNLSGCVLLTEWKQNSSEKVTFMSCEACSMLHLHPSLFIRFNGFNELFNGLPSGDPRPRNGLSSRFLSVFTVCKKLYCVELPSRVALDVSLNAILYAPGGTKYFELADRYKDGFQAYKKRKLI